jgi:DNA-binding IclR family transcriptional regulator
MHATGVGKALLAHQSQAFIQYFCQRPLSRNTRYTITEPGRLVREVSEIRRRGYAEAIEEVALGTCSVAVPILRLSGCTTATWTNCGRSGSRSSCTTIRCPRRTPR